MEQFLEEAKNYAESISKKVQSVEIKDVQDLEQCQSILAYNKEIGKEIQAKKDAITKPMNASLKEIRALFKPIEDKLEETEKRVKGAMLEFKKKLDEERRAEILKMQESDEQELPLQAVENVKTMNTIKTRKIARLKIVNADLIPDKYWTPQEDIIFAVLKAGGEVPGCELVEEEIVINNF